MSAAAKHRRIAADIRRRIADGEWPPGGRLPSRTAMAADYGVHPQTVRLAYVLLRREGDLEGVERQHVSVAHPPAMRTLTDADAPWPHGSETTDTRDCRATEELAQRLQVRVGAVLHHEVQECWDPGGRSAMLVSSWWRGRRRDHVAVSVEVGAVILAEGEAHALRLPVDSVAFRLVRTRLDASGQPVETADLTLPMDRWRLRLLAQPSR